jgi:hypothetical protein
MADGRRRDNLDAIGILKTIEKEGRFPTEDEKVNLVP